MAKSCNNKFKAKGIRNNVVLLQSAFFQSWSCREENDVIVEQAPRRLEKKQKKSRIEEKIDLKRM